jgi:5-aminolevulinate synthase
VNYEGYFKQRLGALHAEGRYRVFADLERRCGRFLRAYNHRIRAEVRLVVIEETNDIRASN